MHKKIITAVIACTLFSWILPCQAQAALICGDFFPCLSQSSSLKKTHPHACDYQVKPGDTLWQIARTHQTTPQELASINKITLETPLQSGQFLQLPELQPEKYAIKPGDTLWSIAQSHATTCQEILHENPTLSAEYLSIGTTIRLPEGAQNHPKNPSVSRKSPESAFAWPLSGTITSPFGQRPMGMHHGIDIAGNTGDAVRASADGTVCKTKFHDIYGNMILIDHTDGQQTLYAHLSQIHVKPGDKIIQGQIIGAVGSTGRSTGPHLHFEIRQNQQAVNPIPYLPR